VFVFACFVILSYTRAKETRNIVAVKESAIKDCNSVHIAPATDMEEQKVWWNLERGYSQKTYGTTKAGCYSLTDYTPYTALRNLPP
jgi:hypothetical protein